MYDRQRELEEEYWYHQNCKWDYLQELKKEHHDPYWDYEEEVSEEEIKELIELDRKAFELEKKMAKKEGLS